MRKSLLTNLILGLGLAIVVASCASPQDITQKPPGFLPDYSLLKQVASPDEDTQIYAYKDPKAKRSDYHAGIVEPVIIYEGTAPNEDAVTKEKIENARKGINEGIKDVVSRKIDITDKPGKGVFRLQVAITGATLEKDSLKPWNLIPVSAAVLLASKATGLDNKKPVLVVELKFTDSTNGKLLKETVTTISGEKFRMESNTSSEFEALAKKWVEEAIKYSSKN